MNKYSKHLKIVGALIGLLMAAVAVLAQVYSSGTLAATTLTVIDSNPGMVGSIQLTDTSGAANSFIVYDSDSNSTTNRVRPGYTGRQYYTTNIVRSWTSSTGVALTETNAVLFSAATTVAASTNEMTRMYVITLPANGTVVFEPDRPLGYTYGLTLYSTGTASYNIRRIPNQ